MRPIRFNHILVQPEDISYLGPFSEAGNFSNTMLVLENGIKLTFKFTEDQLNEFIEKIRIAYENPND